MQTIDKLIEQQGIEARETRQDLVGIVHKLIDNNQTAVKNALYPVGKTCGSLQIGSADKGTMVDLPTVDSIREKGEVEVDIERKYRGRLDGLTLHTKGCKFEFEDNPGKYVPGKITDPEILKKENLYTMALHERHLLSVSAKALKTKEGNIKTLYISDAKVIDGSREILES